MSNFYIAYSVINNSGIIYFRMGVTMSSKNASIIKQASMVLNTFTPQRRKPNPVYAIPEEDKHISGKTIVFTGGTDGMGRAAVSTLHKLGANLIILGRNEEKGMAVARELNAVDGGFAQFLSCDLASMESIRCCAERIIATHKRIDVLVNCAGAQVPKRTITADGLEKMWAINYIGPFLLTNLLLERLKTSAPSRIVNVSSETEALGHINFEDLQTKHGFDALKPYAQAKLALNAFTVELAEQLESSGVTVNALNPGFIRSNLLRDLKGIPGIFRLIMRIFASPPEVGADRIVRLAISSRYSSVTGTYTDEDKISEPNPEAKDTSIRTKLMQISDASTARWRASLSEACK
ncbi:SDR family NAD(P)-dependent oxidoreductase [Pseudovibrio sp. W64]|uniref:SDR family NAD(P)-dependent oxidoreductase n=1 Tax=Pseudovibrio sp. W64 TaxID=1735583 RepID=UPI0009EF59FD|nr:SDR family NAD(P)-dependent oxidoreductase [Pseudovibrio sp. W64]